MLIVEATEADSKEIWAWRNDPDTRSMSITTDVVAWVAHQSWYHDALMNPDRLLFIGWVNGGEKVGMCRFDIDPVSGQTEVSINLNPEMRSKKLSVKLLSAAIQLFWQTRKMPIAATVRKNNAASIKCFSACGFVLASEDSEYQHYLLKP
jgi:RimJ/RimL family protein N-acetyltransferase